MPKSAPRNAREVLEKLCKEYRYYDGVGCSHLFDQALKELSGLVEGLNKKQHGLIPDGLGDATHCDCEECYEKSIYNQAISDVLSLFKADK